MRRASAYRVWSVDRPQVREAPLGPGLRVLAKVVEKGLRKEAGPRCTALVEHRGLEFSALKFDDQA
ncbi:hypothetical protein JM93_03901 [Roseibium hamelinense]|uniref:Uncharacterized protein n=1 Tax=Roseibium hamelinense TaxID=150831 RepID=A0A562SL59_9HYPH|nr:hypothetical protein JM93_03901 [Roseibium hamelinense]